MKIQWLESGPRADTCILLSKRRAAMRCVDWCWSAGRVSLGRSGHDAPSFGVSDLIWDYGRKMVPMGRSDSGKKILELPCERKCSTFLIEDTIHAYLFIQIEKQ